MATSGSQLSNHRQRAARRQRARTELLLGMCTALHERGLPGRRIPRRWRMTQFDYRPCSLPHFEHRVVPSFQVSVGAPQHDETPIATVVVTFIRPPEDELVAGQEPRRKLVSQMDVVAVVRHREVPGFGGPGVVAEDDLGGLVPRAPQRVDE